MGLSKSYFYEIKLHRIPFHFPASCWFRWTMQTLSTELKQHNGRALLNEQRENLFALSAKFRIVPMTSLPR